MNIIVALPVAVGQHGLGYLLSPSQIVVAIRQNLGLNDGHQSILLADRGIAGENLGDFDEREMGRRRRGDLMHATPLCKLSAVLKKSNFHVIFKISQMN